MVRLGGADGHVSVRWSTKDITALEGKDYQGKEGLLEFDNQETTKNIIIPLFESNVRSLCGSACVGYHALVEQDD